MGKIKTGILVAACAIALAACSEHTRPKPGSGPAPTFGTNVKKLWEEYQGNPAISKVFVISIDGVYSAASQCGSWNKPIASTDEKCSNADAIALNACERRAGPGRCFVYAYGDEIVWGKGNQPVTSSK
jgi:hypothetical protein